MISQLQSDAIRAIIARDAETNPRLASILATRPALGAPGQTCERAEHQAAMAGLRPVYLPSPADEAVLLSAGRAACAVTRHTPCPGRPTPAGALEGAK